MAKGIIKTSGASAPKSVTTTTTVAYDTTIVSNNMNYLASSPVGQVLTGTIQDIADPTLEYNFEQPLGTELGIVVGLKVNYNTVVVNGKTVVNMIRLIEKGMIESINATNDGGVLLDRSTKLSIPFAHMYCKESGIVAPVQGGKGSVVSFERVVDPKTAAVTATALELIK